MKPFVVNRHGRLVFPSNFLPELDFSVIGDLERLDAVIGRDFEAKAPTGTDILEAVEADAYASRYELMRDVALNLFWVNRFAMTMYEKRPTRWRDVPRRRDDVFLPVLTPWEDGERKVAAVGAAYDALPAGEDPAAEDRIFRMLFDVFCHRPHHATELPAIKPTVAEILATPGALTFCLHGYDPDYPRLRLRATMRRLPRGRPGARGAAPLGDGAARPVPVGPRADRAEGGRRPRGRRLRRRVRAAQPEVMALHPPRRRRASAPRPRTGGAGAGARAGDARTRPVRRPRAVRACMPRIEALAVVKGEHACTNDDLVRNARVQLVADDGGGDRATRPASRRAGTPSAARRDRAGGGRGGAGGAPAARPRTSAR